MVGNVNKNQLKCLIKECLAEIGNDANFANTEVSNWLETLQSTKVYNIEQSTDKKQIVIKLVDGGVATLSSATPIKMHKIVHSN